MYNRPVLIYVLHSGNLYGTEKMALTTLGGLADVFTPVILAPPGAALEEAKRRGINGLAFKNKYEFACHLHSLLAQYSQISFAATGVTHSIIFLFLNLFYRRRIQHTHLVHGGPNEQDSYGRKKFLNLSKITFITVSEYARERLISHNVNSNKILIIENFLSQHYINTAPRHEIFINQGIRNVAIVSRIDPDKKIDLLLDALELAPELRRIRFRIYGGGASSNLLSRAKSYPNFTFEGYCTNVPEILSKNDLLLHTCPTESFGLVILEGMAAGIPVLVPDMGGASTIITHGVNGIHFKANDAKSLAQELLQLISYTPERINQIVKNADDHLNMKYSSTRGNDEYRKIFSKGLIFD